MKNFSKLVVPALAMLSLLSPVRARAGFTFLPDNRFHLAQTYAFFTDPQLDLYWRTPRKAWGALGGTLALGEMSDWASKPQLILHASANVAYRFNDKYDTILTETIDARVGLFVLFELDSESRILAGWTHQSGHVSDNVPDVSLLGPNLGNEQLSARYFHDFGDHWRAGGTLKPYIGTEPRMKVFSADQFGEWFPWGQKPTRQQASPYVALGFDETGVDHIMFTYHVQLGLLFGNHFRRPHEAGLRAVAGYYRGIDPRLKYAQFMLSRAEFGYVGIAADL